MVNWIRRVTYRGMRLLTTISHWERRRFTPAGRLLLLGVGVAAVFGVDTRQNLAHQMFGILSAALLLAWLVSRRLPGEFTATRRLPRYATVGEPLHYQLQIGNIGNRMQQGLQVQEEAPDPRPDLKTFLSTPAPDERRINAFDRLLGYPRWRWLTNRHKLDIGDKPLDLPFLAPGQLLEIPSELKPARRGYLRLPALSISRVDPLGLCRAFKLLPATQSLLVLPRRYPVAPLQLPGQRRLQPGGITLASSVGESQEFIGLRDYRHGDPVRHIHWPSWARSGKPMVKEFQDEYFSRQALILDSFAPMERVQDFEAAVSAAASFVEPLQGPDSLLDLMFVADRAYQFTAGRGQMSSQGLLEVLASVEQQPTGDFTLLSLAVMEHAGQLSAGLVILLGWDEPRRALVRQLQALGLATRVLIISSDDDVQAGDAATAFPPPRRIRPDQLAEGLMEL